MSESRATGWPSDAPTAAQLKEFFAQIESGRTTKGRLQAFLRQPADDPPQLLRHFDIHELGLGIRAYNCLKRFGIETIGELVDKSEADLKEIPNLGRKPIEEIKEALAVHGLALKGDEPPADEELSDAKAALIDLFTLVGFVNRRLDLPNEIAEVHRLIDRAEEHIQILPVDGVALASDRKMTLEGRLTELKVEQDQLPAKIAEWSESLARKLDIEI